jgi:hypothetical protein
LNFWEASFFLVEIELFEKEYGFPHNKKKTTLNDPISTEKTNCLIKQDPSKTKGALL